MTITSPPNKLTKFIQASIGQKEVVQKRPRAKLDATKPTPNSECTA